MPERVDRPCDDLLFGGADRCPVDLVARGHGELGLARSRATADSAMESG